MRTDLILRERFRHWRNQWSRQRSKATFLAVTGSSGKTTCAELLTFILEAHAPVFSQLYWNTIDPIGKAIRRSSGNAVFAVFEAGVGQKDQMKPMARLIQPSVAIVTMVGLEHYGAFRSKDAVAAEKGELVEAIQPGGFALLNADDDHVMSMANRTDERVVTFGRDSSADYRVVSAKAAYPQCLEIKINCRGREVRFSTQFAGDQFWLSCVAAIAAAMELGVPDDVIVARVAQYAGPTLRFQALETSGPTFILDTVKAPYSTLNVAFDAFKACNFEQKRIVLGHLSDYAGTSKSKYRDAYRSARAIADQVIVVDRHLHRYDDVIADLASGKLLEFETPEQTHEYLRKTARNDEIILLKSSGSLHLERIAMSWDQTVKCWEPKCGRDGTCTECRYLTLPFEQHDHAMDAT
ncbi:MAG: Mur ligase family protein [Hyphomicrobiaceae bacterium]